MRRSVALLPALVLAAAARADDPKLVSKPDAFPTLVNPNCSHCIDEAKRRAGELRHDDPVLVWTRGYSDGGAIPIRFFLAKHRVISDSYGVFVYDPDAGFARGFAPSYNFVFHGWRNGIMVIKDTKDGTLYSSLSGIAFEGPKTGQRLTPVPTLTSTWGPWLKAYPNAVAYHMFDKYKPTELPKKPNPDSVKTRPAKTDPRLKPDEEVLGVWTGQAAVAFPLSELRKYGFIDVRLGDELLIAVHDPATNTATAYRPMATQPRKFKGPNPDKDGVSPPDAGIPLPIGEPVRKPREITPTVTLSLDRKPAERWPGLRDNGTHTWFDIAGRGTGGELQGWTLEPLDAVQCKWFAWSAEYPETKIVRVNKSPAGEIEAPAAQPDPKKDDPTKEVAGAAEFLRLLPKPFATLKAVDPKARTVTLLLEGETVAKVWPVEPDAEVKVMGWWGRLEQLTPGDRVWVWLKLNRKKEPVAVAMIADEMSQQDIHGEPPVILKVDEDKITFTAKKQPTRTLDAGKARIVVDRKKAAVADLELAQKLYVQSAGGSARLIVAPDVFEQHRITQQKYLRQLWVNEGLPGTVSVQHTFSGELELLLDHEAIRWARSLKTGDVVHLAADPPIKAVVKTVSPWRERTQLRLVVGELEASELKPGGRVLVKMTPPAEDVLTAPYPPDIDRPRAREQRVEWFLASTYCTCKVRGDICTGHFYTLASCNPNGCGAPNETRKRIAGLIDKGLSDKQIWDELLKEKGTLMLRPHLLP